MRKRHRLREGRKLIPIKFNFTENFRTMFFSVLAARLAFLSKIEVTRELPRCPQDCFPKEPKIWRNIKLFIFLLSGSIVSWPIGATVGEATAALAHPVDFLPQANAMIATAGIARQDSIGLAEKELALPTQPKIFAPVSTEVIPEAVSLWTANLNRSDIGVAIDPIVPNLNRYLEIPKFSENLPSAIPIDLLAQVRQIDEQQTQQPQPKPSSSPAAEQQTESPAPEVDPDLGRLRLRERSVPPRQPQPVLHIIPRISYFYTTNVFSGVDPVEDSLYFPSLTLWSTPKLGPSTYLIASVDGNLIRYLNESQYDYNLLRFRTGIYQQLTSKMGGEIGWNNQQYFRASNGDRFLDEHFIYMTLTRRDWLNRRLALDSFYDVRLSFANPDNRSRLINYLSVSLSYYFQRNLQVGMDYQFSFSDFTKTDREDYYHRLLGRLVYGVSTDSQINLQGGVTIGGSSDPNIDFDSLFFSVTYSLDLKVF